MGSCFLANILKPYGIKRDMTNAEFMDEYLARLAFGLVQFWPAEDELPDDDEAQSDEAYYAGAIRRLSVFNRAELAKKMRALCSAKAHFFTPSTPRAERTKTVNGVIARFPLLRDAEHEAVVMRDRI